MLGAAATILGVPERFPVAEDDLRRRWWSDDLGGLDGQPPLDPENKVLPVIIKVFINAKKFVLLKHLSLYVIRYLIILSLY